MVRLTPAMEQYMQVKSKYPDTLVLFRMGDFYETFFEDAKTAAKELNIALTARGKGDTRAPLAGIPYHALEQYLVKLVGKGYKVAIVEQTEDPKLAKGLVKRDLVRIVTPGTVMETTMLHDKKNNYIMAIAREKGVYGVALADISTGEFFTAEVKDYDQLLTEISRYAPTECIVPISIEDDKSIVGLRSRTVVHSFDDRHFWDKAAVDTIFNHFGVQSLAGFGLEGRQLCVNASGALLSYLKETQKTSLLYINSLRYLANKQHMALDATTQRNLELVRNIREGATKNTLLEAIDATLTPMGARLIRKWVLQPLLSVDEIRRRQDAVCYFLGSLTKREDLRDVMKKITDIERSISKLNYGNANARDMLALHNALQHAPLIKRLLSDAGSGLLAEISAMPDVSEVTLLISTAIKDDPPVSIREGGFIKQGYNGELDKLRDIIKDSKGYILRLEEEERKKTGIKSLKIKFNKVFGYFIEVTKPNLHLVPANYARKQTQVNAERFITDDLKQRESEILGAEEKIMALEYELFCDVVSKVVARTKEIQKIASSIATLDVIQSFAHIAAEYNYVKPEVNDSNCIVIREGRHPVIERLEKFYVPNDMCLDSENRTHIITGPNMSGKSSYMRQVALIVLMAQIGSMVPAKSATIGLVDRIFTRVGAFDDLASGQSTFMVEMTETANILNNATSKSLVILDEIGRGTSTYDGISIAWAVAEHIHASIGAKTLFATHYHQMNRMAELFPGVKNFNIAVKEKDDEIVFLHKVLEGGTDKSYGIQVAKLAGVPAPVISRSKKIMNQLSVEDEVAERLHRDLRHVRDEKSEKVDDEELFDNGQKTLLDLE